MPSILFLSDTCLLDGRSETARSVRALLEGLAEIGWKTQALTMTLCEGEAEQPLSGLHAALTDLRPGEAHTLVHNRVPHELLVAHSTRHTALRPWEMRWYTEAARQHLAAFAPDIVLTWRFETLRPVLLEAQQRGARTLFYLATPGYASPHYAPQEDTSVEGIGECIDEVVMPSQALVDFYQQHLGIEGRLLRDMVAVPFPGQQNLQRARVITRHERFVTMFHPDPARGGLFFINLAVRVNALNPGIRFRVVESAWGRCQWEQLGVPAEYLDTIDWHPPTTAVSTIYEQAALLVVPSLWFEPAGRVVPEALLAGVPVLATRSGSLPEQLGKGGFLFDVPAGMAENHLASPPRTDIQQWAKFIAVLMKDDTLYTRAVRLALTAAKPHHPTARREEMATVFDALQRQSALAGVGNEAVAREHLDQLRQTMNAQREAINARLDSNDPTTATPSSAKVLSTKCYPAKDLPEQGDPYAKLLTHSLAQPAIRDALNASKSGDLEQARAILEQYLRLIPEDIIALSLLADTADRQGRETEARHLMERVIELAPGFVAGHQQLVRYLRHAGDAETALRHSGVLLERAPSQPRYQALHANLLTRANRFDEAIRLYERFFACDKGLAPDWLQYALALKTVGQQEKAVAAYREAIAQAPGKGAAWHALSNMKLAVFSDADITTMEATLTRPDLTDEDRYNIHFTLGKAYEDRQAYAPSFTHYAQGNGIRRAQSDYDIGLLEDYVAQAKETFTREFFAAREGVGASAPDPIFIVGLHRAGSTLTEQILSSHSQIEGTRELPNMLHIGRDFGGIAPSGQELGLNKALLGDLDAEEFAELGRQFLESTRDERRTDRPFFIDKMPANWMYTGLIHLILPNAKIIDIRREPMAAGFALFKMNFGRGVEHAYDQKDIARYYRAYADLMAHFDEVLPGRVHHLQYEALVERTEEEIRRVIDYCQLPFEAQCLRYWETERAVQTPSSEQVRRPIFKDAMAQWRHYADWLTPMRDVFAE